MRILLDFQTLAQLKNRFNSHIMTGFRNFISASRVAIEYNSRMQKMGQARINFGGVACIDTGLQTSIAGFGSIYQNFKENGKIENYTGEGTPLVQSTATNFADAPFREVGYADTFANSTSKVKDSEFIFPYSFKLACT